MCGAALIIPPSLACYQDNWAEPQLMILVLVLFIGVQLTFLYSNLHKSRCTTQQTGVLRQIFLRQLKRNRSTHSKNTASCQTWSLALQTTQVFNIVCLTSGTEGRSLCQIPQESHATLQCYTWYENINHIYAFIFLVPLQKVILFKWDRVVLTQMGEVENIHIISGHFLDRSQWQHHYSEFNKTS